MNTYVNTITIAYGMRHCGPRFGPAWWLRALPRSPGGRGRRAAAARRHAQVDRHDGPGRGAVRAAAGGGHRLLAGPVLLCTGPAGHPLRRGRAGARPLAAGPARRVVAMLLWLVEQPDPACLPGLRDRPSPTYGALSAPVAILLFLYFTALAVLLGAELNAEIARLRRPGRLPRESIPLCAKGGHVAPGGGGPGSLAATAGDPVSPAWSEAAGPPKIPAPTETNFATLVRSISTSSWPGPRPGPSTAGASRPWAARSRPSGCWPRPPRPCGPRAVGTKSSPSRTLPPRSWTAGRARRPAAARVSDEEVVARLSTVRGIGKWSAEIFLMFQLRRMDVWPTGDLGIRKGFGLAWKVPTPTPKQLDLRASRTARTGRCGLVLLAGRAAPRRVRRQRGDRLTTAGRAAR